MSNLKIYRNADPNQCEDIGGDSARISKILKDDLGITFEHWETNDAVDGSADHAQIKAAYADHIDRINAIWKFNTIDIIAMKPDHPDKVVLRAKFLDEHRHTEDEVRFFVEGSGLFFIHGDNNSVYQVLCEKQDLISVPANSRHWFDMGPEPHFTAIRFFHNPEGWVAHYTGDQIAADFPRMDS